MKNHIFNSNHKINNFACGAENNNYSVNFNNLIDKNNQAFLLMSDKINYQTKKYLFRDNDCLNPK